jgi:hypothetical protein
MKITITPTPNPNAIKITLERVIADRGKTFDSPNEAAFDPLASAIFKLAGVQSVFILKNFITVTKKPDADWKALTPELEKTLHSFYS